MLRAYFGSRDELDSEDIYFSLEPRNLVLEGI
jgi:hypothetical protein